MNYNLLDSSNGKYISNKYGLPPFCANVLATYSHEQISDILTYQDQEVIFTQMNSAVNLIKEHINNKNNIIIIGDYDCDGILATSILYNAFSQLNYQVNFYIPNRLTDGYGLSKEIVAKVLNKDYKLIITVDNGINAQEAINLALDNDVDVIISDHHEMMKELQTTAIYVHPTFSNLDYYVSGGFVAYHLAKNLLNKEDEYLQALAAITLISDVMPLIKGNRLFLRNALTNINKYKYPAIYALSNKFIDSAEIANIIAPKINSLGRLADLYNPNQLVKYFNATNKNEIYAFSKKIEECNNLRKDMTTKYYQKYQDIVPNNNLFMIEDDNLHEGLIGLLASRFAYQYNVPTFVATKNDDHYKASLRGVAGFDLLQVIKDNGDLFIKYGGHQQALGLSYEATNSQEIKNQLEQSLKEMHFTSEVKAIAINPEDLEINNIKSLRYLEPFGNSFEKPKFVIIDAIVASVKNLKGNIHFKINIIYGHDTFELLLFNKLNLDLKINQVIDCIISVGINEFNNKEKISLIIEDYCIK